LNGIILSVLTIMTLGSQVSVALPPGDCEKAAQALQPGVGFKGWTWTQGTATGEWFMCPPYTGVCQSPAHLASDTLLRAECDK